MNPFFFGTGRRPLFGIYEPAKSGSNRQGVVLCYPWGQEYLRAHQSFRFLSRLLAGAGVDVLRFDYYGTGDSGGESAEGDPEAWLDDIEMAIDELRDTADLREVSLIGLRLGGTLAAMCAKRRRDVVRLVLWDVVSNGKAYVSELLTGAQLSRTGAGHLEVSGFPLTAKTRRGMEAIEPSLYDAALPRTLLVSVLEEPDDNILLQRHMNEHGVHCSTAHLPGPTVWIEDGDFGTSGMPVGALKGIVSWVTG